MLNILKKIMTPSIMLKIIVFIVIALLQIAILCFSFTLFSKYIVWIFGGFSLFSLIIIIIILNNHDNPMYKLAWIIPILIVPVFGSVIYMYIKLNFITSNMSKRHINILNNTKKYKKQKNIIINNPCIKGINNYLNNHMNYPTYQNTKIEYFALGEDFFESILKNIKKAKKFIFIEYFIIADNYMWRTILELLKEKVKEGVEVRVMYDAMGCLATLPNNYDKHLRSLGIKTRIFSQITPFLSTYQNCRDHRKILVIDGVIGYNGGINLSDEYINYKKRFGHWKDTAILLEGEAVNSLTIMFLELWDIFEKTPSKYDEYITETNIKNDSYITPYADSPLDKDNVGQEMYLDVINSATEYVYINTPYLIIDASIMSALKHSAKRGVDTKIVLPYIADKRLTNYLTKSYYEELIGAGVKIYEYTPGFVHAKSFVSDDDKAIIGTINLDYRSLFLHFECAVFIYKDKVIDDIKKDFIKTLSECQNITLDIIKKYPPYKRIIGRILRIFAPLM